MSRLQEFKDKWIGRKYRCNDTGIVVELTDDIVFPRAFIGVGNGAIDLGDGYYSRRIGNVEEVVS
jgi:hypothetical protein